MAYSRGEIYLQAHNDGVQRNTKKLQNDNQAVAYKSRKIYHDTSFSDSSSVSLVNISAQTMLQSETVSFLTPQKYPFYWNQQHLLQSDMRLASAAFQSLTDQNDSRNDTVALETQAKTFSNSPASKAVNYNSNAMGPGENKSRSYYLERGAYSEFLNQNQSKLGKKLQKSNKEPETKSKQQDKAEGKSPKNEMNEKQMKQKKMKGKAVKGDENGDQVVSYDAQTLVEVKVVFVRIFEIDTVGQQFEASVYIQARWAESQFSGFSEEQLQETDFNKCWSPLLSIVNVVGTLDVDKASMLLRYEPDRVYPVVTYMWHVEGVFRESLELQHFPFDVQDISIVLTSDRSIQEIELVCDYSQLSNVSLLAMQGNQEWTIYRHVEFTRDFNTMETLSAVKHPVLVATAHAKRKLGAYFWNIFLIVLLILAMSLTILAIEPHNEDRLIATITLFLTAIAFKLVVKTTLPSVSYLTYMDIYVVFVLAFLTMQATENAIMIHLKRFRSNTNIELYDEICQGCLIALMIIFHIALIIYIQMTALGRRRSMKDKELDFEVAKINLNKEKPQDTNTTEADKGGKGNEIKTQNTNTPKSSQESIEVNNPLYKPTPEM